MGSNTDNIASQSLEVQNNMIQASSEVCQADCNQVQVGNITFIKDFDASKCGQTNFDVNVQNCSVSSSCYMNQNLAAQVNNMVKAMAQQTTTTEQSFFNFTFDNEVNSASLEESVTNTFSQIMKNVCSSTNNQIQNKNMTVIEGITGVCNLNANVQNGDASASCTMNNLAKTATYNGLKAATDQNASVKNFLTAIIVSIAVAVIIGGILLVLVILGIGGFGAVAYMGSGSKGGQKEESQVDLNKIIEDIATK